MRDIVQMNMTDISLFYENISNYIITLKLYTVLILESTES